MLLPYQRGLEAIYGVSVPWRVDDFVLSDPQVAAALTSEAGSHRADETLFLRDDGEDLLLSLFLDESLLSRLATDNPLDALHDGNLGDFALALEGVSHFLYVTWSAESKQGVSQVELELQGRSRQVRACLRLALHGSEPGSRCPRCTGACSRTRGFFRTWTTRRDNATGKPTTAPLGTARAARPLSHAWQPHAGCRTPSLLSTSPASQHSATRPRADL